MRGLMYVILLVQVSSTFAANSGAKWATPDREEHRPSTSQNMRRQAVPPEVDAMHNVSVDPSNAGIFVPATAATAFAAAGAVTQTTAHTSTITNTLPNSTSSASDAIASSVAAIANVAPRATGDFQGDVDNSSTTTAAVGAPSAVADDPKSSTITVDETVTKLFIVDQTVTATVTDVVMIKEFTIMTFPSALASPSAAG